MELQNQVICTYRKVEKRKQSRDLELTENFLLWQVKYLRSQCKLCARKTIPVMACSHSLMKEEADEGRKYISVVSVVFLPLHDFACLIFYLSSSILTGPVLHLVPSLLRSRSINVLLVHLLFQAFFLKAITHRGPSFPHFTSFP